MDNRGAGDRSAARKPSGGGAGGEVADLDWPDIFRNLSREYGVTPETIAGWTPAQVYYYTRPEGDADPAVAAAQALLMGEAGRRERRALAGRG